SLRKFIKQQVRLVTAAEYHQMAGRAGRPQFDDRGLAITLAPEEIVSDLKKELKDAAKRPAYDEGRVKKGVYNRARSDAQRKGDLVWTPEIHAELVKGEPAELRSKTKITAEQVLAIGLPDLAKENLAATDADKRMAEAEASLPPSMRLDIVTVIENLLLTDRERKELSKTMAQLVDNLKAIGVIDEHGKQIAGDMIRQLQGMDGLFIYYVLFNHQLDYVELRQLVEYLIDHDIIQRQLDRKLEDAKREWMRAKLREMRETNPQVAWEDVEELYYKEHPRELTKIEWIHTEFASKVPHPELHGGKRAKNTWATMEDANIGFLEFIDQHHLQHEEGNLFSYLIRVMNFAQKLHQASQLTEFEDMADRVRKVLARIDLRLLEGNQWI
ncbi:MAG TPA: hypothetical protein VK427_20535, partial [Kofleriaceae bacterium]|nr:hypothetical protein [Kofleriaceae bacterium]